MDAHVEKNTIRIGTNRVSFPYDIRSVEQVSNLYIILLGIPFDADFTRNVYGVNQEGEVVWQVQDPNDLLPAGNNLPLEHMYVNDEQFVIAANFNGVTFTINPANGEIVKTGATK